jgi:hypothetical protein
MIGEAIVKLNWTCVYGHLRAYFENEKPLHTCLMTTITAFHRHASLADRPRFTPTKNPKDLASFHTRVNIATGCESKQLLHYDHAYLFRVQNLRQVDR